VTITTRLGKVSGFILEFLAAITPMNRWSNDPRSHIPIRIEDEIRLRWQWQITRDLRVNADVNRLHVYLTGQVKEWSNEQ